MRNRRISYVDVFGSEPLRGNPVAVIHDAEGLSPAQMARIANWTNLSETTFLLQPSDPQADYRVRIFTATEELPFAGHPTLGTAHAWLSAGGNPANSASIVQECAAGLVEVRRNNRTLGFAAPPMIRSGAVDEADLSQAIEGVGLTRDDVLDANWVDNGPGWLGLLVVDAERVLAAVPNEAAMGQLKVGLIGMYREGPADVEVRAFYPGIGGIEDPVTGSLNASLAQWLMADGRLPERYLASQGTALGRAGRVHLAREGDQVWVSGTTRTVVTGQLDLS